LVSTPGVYQAAISGGQMFLLAGLLVAFDAVWQGVDGSPRRFRLVFAGSAFALALGCRISLGPCVALLVAATALATSWYARARVTALLRNAIYLGTPVAIGVFCLLLYNKLRFDDWREFGTNHQLTMVPFRVSSQYIRANLYAYLLSPFGVSCRFPYALQSWVSGPKGLPAWVATPKGYLVAEPVTGWLRAVPITWLLPFAIALAVSQGLLLRRTPGRPDAPTSHHGRRRIAYVWCAGCLALLATVAGAITLGFHFSTMRYLGDTAFGLVALSLLGGYSLVAYAPSRLRRGVSAGVVSALAASTIVLGLLLGYQGYNEQIKYFNPALDAALVRALSVCPPPPAPSASR
jgi:hypothetical protein